jgi:thioredoxin 1
MASASRKTLKTSVLLVILGLAGVAVAWLAYPGLSGRSPAHRSSSGTPGDDKIPSVSEATFDEEVLRSRIPVLVDFYADWCGPCRQLAPVLGEMAREIDTAKIVKVNVDESPNLADRYRIDVVPTLIVFRDGQVVAKQTGSVGKDRLKAMLDL